MAFAALGTTGEVALSRADLGQLPDGVYLAPFTTRDFSVLGTALVERHQEMDSRKPSGKSRTVPDRIADVPAGAKRRLTDHYGPGIQDWLRDVPVVIAELACRWRIAVSGYHDAGWTSVVAAGRDDAGRPVIIKVLSETERFQQERDALEHWAGAGVCRLVAADDAAQALLIESVTETPGGAARPPSHAALVARAIHRLHERRVTADGIGSIPQLTEYYMNSVVPRIARRAERWGEVIGLGPAARALELCHDLAALQSTPAVLHSDLYAENVLFDEHSQPVFIDPHPKIGSAAFDWAFWCVYYVPAEGFAERIKLCRQHTPCDMNEVLAWAATLAVDGAMYYLDTSDTTAPAMLALLNSPALAPLLAADAPNLRLPASAPRTPLSASHRMKGERA